MDKKILTTVIALVISVAFVSLGMAQQSSAAAQKPASAQSAPPREKWEKVRGTIENVNEANKEITVQTQKEKMTFSVGENTKISGITTRLPFSDLKKGMSVTVEYAKEGNKLMGEWIDVHMAKAEAHPMTLAQAKEVKKENPSEKTTENYFDLLGYLVKLI